MSSAGFEIHVIWKTKFWITSISLVFIFEYQLAHYFCFINKLFSLFQLSSSAIKDYNRGRAYLIDLAKRQNIPVYSNIEDALKSAVEKLNYTRWAIMEISTKWICIQLVFMDISYASVEQLYNIFSYLIWMARVDKAVLSWSIWSLKKVNLWKLLNASHQKT